MSFTKFVVDNVFSQISFSDIKVHYQIFYLFGLVYLLIVTINYFIVPKPIKNLPLVHTPLPILNGLEVILPKPRQVSDSPCLKFYRLSMVYGEVYQIYFGTKLIVVANSYDSVKQLWCSKNVKGNNSRPVSYSFHNILSKGVYTIGTTPIGDVYRRSRKHVSERVLCNKRNKDFNYLLMDKFSNELIDDLVDTYKKDNNTSSRTIISTDILREAQYFHLKLALWLTYGFELNTHDVVHKKLADEIIEVENKITKVRSHIQNAQDYLPIYVNQVLNLFSRRNHELNELYGKRENYLQMFYKYSKDRYDNVINRNIQIDDVIESQKMINKIEDLKNTMMFNYFNESNQKVSLQEVTSECLTMVSAGLDNTPLNFKYGLHQLLNYHPEIWEVAFQDLVQYYDHDFERAYRECAIEMKSEYVKAIVQETLRLFTVLPLALPREATSNIYYKNAVIPKGTILFMNCWAGNHDKEVFPDPMEFQPKRWLTTVDGKTVIDPAMKHLSFGIGCRRCLGNNFAIRELYILFSKMILVFEPVAKQENGNTTVPPSDPLALNRYPESLAIEPIPFNIVLQKRVSSSDSTSSFYLVS